MAFSIIAVPKKKNGTDGYATIYIRGYYNRKPVASISTGKKIELMHWDPVFRRVIDTAPNATMINLVIQNKLQKMQNDLMKKEIMGTSVNREHIAKVIRNVDDSKDFYQFCTDRIAEYANAETKRTYTSEVTKLKQFQDPVSFSDIDYSFLTRYKMYMTKKRGNAKNTVWKSMKFIDTMIGKAIKTGGIIESNPFDDYDRGKYQQGRRGFLEMDHCARIEKLTTNENEMVQRVAIYFLMMAYSGMRFGDAMLFDPEIHIYNNDRIIMKYEKCGTDVNIKLYDRLRRIVDLVENNRLNVTNQCFNKWLKVIAIACKIPINLSAHVGRHTMGSTLAELEIPEEQAQIIMGHKDIRSTRIYYHMKSKTIDAAMDKFNTIIK